MNEDGNMARLPDLEIFAETHGLKIISVADLIKYRMQKEICVRRVAEAVVPTIYGDFRAVAFENQLNRDVHLVMIKGNPEIDDSETLVRVHTQCVLGDVFGGLVDDAGWQLQRSLKIISAAEKGVILYLNLQGRSRDIIRHLEIYGHGTKEANRFNDAHGSTRDYGIGAQILHEIGLRRIRLLTNHPKKLTALEGFDIEITGFEPLIADEVVGLRNSISN
jgi:3,4-dihydroxy 2-butanone 4-phosphate synthase/GTP cyclohydrolase II